MPGPSRSSITADSKQPAIHPANSRIGWTGTTISTTIGVSRPVREHDRIERAEHIAAHAKPAGAHDKGFRALIGASSNDFRPLPKFPSRAEFGTAFAGALAMFSLLPWRCDPRRSPRPVVIVRLRHRVACSRRQRRLRPRPRLILVAMPSVLLSSANLLSSCRPQPVSPASRASSR